MIASDQNFYNDLELIIDQLNRRHYVEREVKSTLFKLKKGCPHHPNLASDDWQKWLKRAYSVINQILNKYKSLRLGDLLSFYLHKIDCYIQSSFQLELFDVDSFVDDRLNRTHAITSIPGDPYDFYRDIHKDSPGWVKRFNEKTHTWRDSYWNIGNYIPAIYNWVKSLGRFGYFNSKSSPIQYLQLTLKYA